MSAVQDTANNKGFTLLEMLVALFVFGLIAAAGVAVLAHAADNREVVQQRLHGLQEFQRARALLRADLGQAAVRRVRHGQGQPARRALLSARAGDVQPLLGFVRRGWENPERQPRASLQYVEYRLVDERLERSSRPMLDGATAEQPVVLLRGVQSASLQYRFRDQWLSGWPGGAEDLPSAIRLDMQLQSLGEVSQLFLLPAGAGR